MTFVGIALAIGLHIDVGIVVRSLADSIGMVDKDDLPLPIERQFMFLLSSKSGHARKEVCDPVDEYAYSWWLQKGPFGARPLCRWTLEDCLYTHRQVQQDAGVFRNSTTRPVPSPELSATDTPRSPPVPEQYRCQTCILYRHACGALQSDLVQIKAFGATQLNVALVKTATARRTIAAAYIFRQALLLKDASAATTPFGPHPAALNDAEVLGLIPLIAAALGRRPLITGAEDQARRNDSSDAESDSGNMFSSDGADAPLASADAAGREPLPIVPVLNATHDPAESESEDESSDGENMFGPPETLPSAAGDDAIRKSPETHALQESAEPQSEGETSDGDDMFGPPEVVTLSAAHLHHQSPSSQRDDVESSKSDSGGSMFGQGSDGEGQESSSSGPGMYSSDEDAAADTDIPMYSSAEETSSAIDMFSAAASNVPLRQPSPAHFTAEHFTHLSDHLFEDPEDSD